MNTMRERHSPINGQSNRSGGAFALVLEGVAADLADQITRTKVTILDQWH